MKCPTIGTLQAYIDKELDKFEARELEAHLGHCSKCRNRLQELTENNRFAEEKATAYRDHVALKNINLNTTKKKTIDIYSINTINPVPDSISSKGFNKKDVKNYMLKYKKYIAAATCALVITGCVSISPVKAALSSALSIFRVENVKGIDLSLEDINKIQNELKNHEGVIDLDKLGKVQISKGEQKLLKYTDLRSNLAFTPILYPSSKDSNTVFKKVAQTSISFTLNIKNVNSLMSSLGSKELLPDDLEGKSFTIMLPEQFIQEVNINNKHFSIIEAQSPQLIAPSDADIDRIYSVLVQLPVLPQDLQQQLKAIKDWKNTAYVPVIKSKMQETDINGAKGYCGDLNFDNENTEKDHYGAIWMRDKLFIGVTSNISLKETLDMARSLR